ncbi:hypothetical protein ACRALDRAFT_2017506 [Sodiomyces alcalophilus JCM 7366]|uniref:uncharacterized protein n=1 Tax=Sodiomyces alcalophilus JCM 7366 TaxID=591952 RepID=UPI0039B66C32
MVRTTVSPVPPLLPFNQRLRCEDTVLEAVGLHTPARLKVPTFLGHEERCLQVARKTIKNVVYVSTIYICSVKTTYGHQAIHITDQEKPVYQYITGIWYVHGSFVPNRTNGLPQCENTMLVCRHEITALNHQYQSALSASALRRKQNAHAEEYFGGGRDAHLHVRNPQPAWYSLRIFSGGSCGRRHLTFADPNLVNLVTGRFTIWLSSIWFGKIPDQPYIRKAVNYQFPISSRHGFIRIYEELLASTDSMDS